MGCRSARQYDNDVGARSAISVLMKRFAINTHFDTSQPRATQIDKHQAAYDVFIPVRCGRNVLRTSLRRLGVQRDQLMDATGALVNLQMSHTRIIVWLISLWPCVCALYNHNHYNNPSVAHAGFSNADNTFAHQSHLMTSRHFRRHAAETATHTHTHVCIICVYTFAGTNANTLSHTSHSLTHTHGYITTLARTI